MMFQQNKAKRVIGFNGVDYEETGEGPTVLFVPGSYSTAAAWRGIQLQLSEKYRCVSTCLRGYGNSRETRNFEDFDIEIDLFLVRETAERIGAPVHLVGHSFGATVGLAAALDGAVEALSITTFEANPIALLSSTQQNDLFESACNLSVALEEAHFGGDPNACSLVIDFWGGADTFAKMPEAVQDYCRKKTYTNILDWRTVRTFQVTSQDYSRLDMPVLLVRGEHANPVMIEITDTLEASLPDAKHAIVGDAGHSLISTHAAECADHLFEFLEEVTDGANPVMGGHIDGPRQVGITSVS